MYISLSQFDNLGRYSGNGSSTTGECDKFFDDYEEYGPKIIFEESKKICERNLLIFFK